MKRLSISFIFLTLILGSFVHSIRAQDLSAKDLFLAHSQNRERGKPGVKISIELLRDGRRSFVPRNYSFQSGDKVKFHFETNFDSYVRLLNVGSRGTLKVLYPYPGAPEKITSMRSYAIPQGDIWMEFDEIPGTESLNFIFSSIP